jgi:hypothetical protein
MDINPERKRDWGRRLEVFWEGDGVYYRGTVTGYSTTSGKHTIMYDDGDVERVQLSKVRREKLLGRAVGTVWNNCPNLASLAALFVWALQCADRTVTLMAVVDVFICSSIRAACYSRHDIGERMVGLF